MGVGAITLSGLASDLDIPGIITQLASIKQRPIDLLAQQQSTYVANLTVFQQLSAKVLGMGAMVSGLQSGAAFEQVTVSSSDTAHVVATGASGAAAGNYEIEISQLATNHKISSGVVAASDEALGYQGEILVNGSVVSVGAADTLEDLRDAINIAGAGVSASILTVSDTDHRLLVQSLTTGASGALNLVDANGSDILEGLGLQTGATAIKYAITDGAASEELSDKFAAVGSVIGLTGTVAGTVQINGTNVAIDLSADSLTDIAAAIDAVADVSASVVPTDDGYRLEIVGAAGTPTFTDDGNVLATLGVLSKGIANEMQAAQDSQFTIGGIAMTRSTNAVDDAIEGVQLQLVAATGGTPTQVSVAWNVEAAVAEVEQMVSYYNSLVSFVNTNQAFNTDTDIGGAFLGNMAVMNLESALREQVTGLVNTLGGDLLLGSQVGLTTNYSDELVFDSAAFRSALQANPAGVARLFGEASEATSADVAVAGTAASTRDSGADGWAVNITQIAEQATAQSAVLASGITLDETLTIGGVGVTLTAGMSLDDGAELLNSLFTAQHMSIEATVVGDRLQVQHELWGTSYGIVITSSLDDGAGGTDLGGATAGVADNYSGQNVAGTIGGEAATGRGRTLTADDGTDAAGLVLTVTATSAGDQGLVRVSKGIGSRLSSFASAVTNADYGTLTLATNNISSEIEAIDEEMDRLSDSVNRYIEQLQLDFARMESRMSQSNSLLDWMTMQMDALSSFGNSN